MTSGYGGSTALPELDDNDDNQPQPRRRKTTMARKGEAQDSMEPMTIYLPKLERQALADLAYADRMKDAAWVRDVVMAAIRTRMAAKADKRQPSLPGMTTGRRTTTKRRSEASAERRAERGRS